MRAVLFLVLLAALFASSHAYLLRTYGTVNPDFNGCNGTYSSADIGSGKCTRVGPSGSLLYVTANATGTTIAYCKYTNSSCDAIPFSQCQNVQLDTCFEYGTLMITTGGSGAGHIVASLFATVAAVVTVLF